MVRRVTRAVIDVVRGLVLGAQASRNKPLQETPKSPQEVQTQTAPTIEAQKSNVSLPNTASTVQQLVREALQQPEERTIFFCPEPVSNEGTSLDQLEYVNNYREFFGARIQDIPEKIIDKDLQSKKLRAADLDFDNLKPFTLGAFRGQQRPIIGRSDLSSSVFITLNGNGISSEHLQCALVKQGETVYLAAKLLPNVANENVFYKNTQTKMLEALPKGGQILLQANESLYILGAENKVFRIQFISLSNENLESSEKPKHYFTVAEAHI